MYVFNIDDNIEKLDDKKNIDNIIKNGLAVKLGDMYLLSKTNTIVIDEIKIETCSSLENYIECFDGGEYVTLSKDVEIGKSDAIEILCGSLYQSHEEGVETYAEKIYNSENPYSEIEGLINDFLLIAIDIKISDIENEIESAKKDIENQIELGAVNWQ